MADSKISALTSGNPAQSGDEIPIARGGANYKITAGSIASLGGDVDGPASSVDNQIALFDSTTGKLIKAATTTGVLKASSGVIAAATSGTDYAPATTGTSAQLLANSGSGGFSNVTVGSGLTLSAGTLSASGGGLAWQSVQTTGFTAVAGRAYPCNTTSAAFTVTLPASPSAGNVITLTDYAGTWGTNNLTVGRNGSNINGLASNLVLSSSRNSIQLAYVDSTQGWVIYSGWIQPIVSVEYLVVAGGGGGGYDGTAGGGGAGGMLTSTLNVATLLPVTITVGGGGSGGTAAGNATNGNNSVFSSVTGLKGGKGGDNNTAGTGGSGTYGSGGGSGFISGSAGGAGTSGQGNAGGAGNGASPGFGSGGGGGAGSAGTAGASGSAGGNGLQSSLSGTALYYAGGGGGGNVSAIAPGGNSVGGDGGSGSTAATNGATNRGGGGGGAIGGGTAALKNGGNGGSGVVILKIPASNTATFSGGVTQTSTTSGGYTIYTVTATSTTSETVTFS
jgi:hypothetical protein